MLDIWCVLDLRDAGWGRRFVLSAMGDVATHSGMVKEVVLDEPGILMGVRRRQDQPGVRGFGEQEVVVHGLVCAELSEFAVADGLDYERLLTNPPDGLYNILIWDREAKALRIGGDLLGARRLYYWENGGEVALSSNLKAFRHLPGGRPPLDGSALSEILTLCHPLEDRTLLKGVHHVPADYGLVCSAAGVHRVPRRCAWSGLPEPAERSVRECAETIDRAMARGVSAWVQDASGVNVSLSGGMDSRLILPYVLQTRADVEASTFGDPRTYEAKYADRLCRSAGVPHRLCELRSRMSLSHEELSSFSLKTEWFGDSAGPFYWRRWLRFLKDRGLPVITGYLGDVLGGKRLLSWSVPPEKLELAPEACLADVASHPHASGRALERFAYPAFRQELAADTGERLADAFARLPGEKAYSRIVALDLSQRQRRFISWFPVVVDQVVPALNPFCTRGVFEAFASVPLSGRLGRAAVHEVLRRRFPQALRIPDANSGRLPEYRSVWEEAWDKFWHSRYTHKLIRMSRGMGLRPVGYFSCWIRRHAGVIADELARPNPALAGFLDLPAIAKGFRRGGGFHPYLAMRLYNVSVFARKFYL